MTGGIADEGTGNAPVAPAADALLPFGMHDVDRAVSMMPDDGDLCGAAHTRSVFAPINRDRRLSRFRYVHLVEFLEHRVHISRGQVLEAIVTPTYPRTEVLDSPNERLNRQEELNRVRHEHLMGESDRGHQQIERTWSGVNNLKSTAADRYGPQGALWEPG
jgi:hypothetical protein